MERIGGLSCSLFGCRYHEERRYRERVCKKIERTLLDSDRDDDFPDWCPLETLAAHDKRVRDEGITALEEALTRGVPAGVSDDVLWINQGEIRAAAQKLKE